MVLLPVDLRVELEPPRVGVEADGLAQRRALADRPLEDDLGAQRASRRRPRRRRRRAVGARLEVRRVDVPGVPGDRVVLVELEAVARARPAPRGPWRGRRGSHSAPSSPSSARRCAFASTTAPSTAARPRPVVRLDDAAGAAARAARPSRPPSRSTTSRRGDAGRADRDARRPPQTPPAIASAPPRRPPRGRARARTLTSVMLVPGRMSWNWLSSSGRHAARAPRAGTARRRRRSASSSSASCSARSAAAVAALERRLGRVGAAVVLEVQLADDRAQVARVGLELVEERLRRPSSIRGRPAGRGRGAGARASSRSARRRRRRGRTRAASRDERAWSR